MGLGIATIGGIMLIIGAYFVYRGEIFRSVLIYLMADCIWFTLGILSGDYIGATLIAIGAILGFLAFLKMKNGTMRKDLKK